MTVVRNDICCVGCESTVNELVVVGVCRNGMELEVRVNEFYVVGLYNGSDNVLRNGLCRFSCYDFLVLFQDVIGNASSESLCLKVCPDAEVFASYERLASRQFVSRTILLLRMAIGGA